MKDKKVFDFVKNSDRFSIDWSKPDYTGASAGKYVGKYTNRPEHAGNIKGMQNVLGGVGMVFDPADWLNAAIYAGKGDVKNAALYASGVGLFARIGKKFIKPTSKFKFNPNEPIKYQNLSDTQFKRIIEKEIEEEATTAYAYLSKLATKKNPSDFTARDIMEMRKKGYFSTSITSIMEMKVQAKKIVQKNMKEIEKRKKDIIFQLNELGESSWKGISNKKLQKMKTDWLIKEQKKHGVTDEDVNSIHQMIRGLRESTNRNKKW